MATAARHTKGNDNYYRYSRLLLDVAARVLRQYLVSEAGKQTPPLTVHAFLAAHKRTLHKLAPRVLRQNRLDLIYPPLGGQADLDTWDITLLCSVITNTCTMSNTEEMLVRTIREIRNVTYGHLSQANMTNAEFSKHWTDLVGQISGLVNVINDQTFKDEIDDFIDFIKSERQTGKYLMFHLFGGHEHLKITALNIDKIACLDE